MAKKKIKAKLAASTSPPDDGDELSFEAALAELEQIVARLEGGQLGLEAALAQYESGVKHLKTCYRQLNDAERRIELVARIDAAGRVESTKFDDAASIDLADKAGARSQRRSSAAPRRDSFGDDGGTLF